MRSSNRSFRNNLLGLVLAVSAVQCWTDGKAFGQGVSQNGGGITDIQATAMISVDFEIRAADKSIVIPYCGGGNSGNFFTCYGAAYLEVSDGKLWKRAKPPKNLMATLAAPTREGWKPMTMAVGDANHFVFAFDPMLFGIRRGDHLRIIANAWTSQESMRDHDPDTTFASPVFDCP